MTIRTNVHDFVIRPRAADRAHVKNVRGTKGVSKPDTCTFRAKPWGFEYACLRDKYFDIWELFLDPSASTSAHIHTKKDVLMLVLKGSVILKTSKKMELLESREYRVIKRGALHQIINETNERVRVLEIESPPDRNDLVRVQDKYGRVGLPYFHPSEQNQLAPETLSLPQTIREHYDSFHVFALTREPEYGTMSYPVGIRCQQAISSSDSKRLGSLQQALVANELRHLFVLEGTLTIRGSMPIILRRGNNTLIEDPKQLVSASRNAVFIGW